MPEEHCLFINNITEIFISYFQVFKRAKVTYKDIVCTDYEAVNTADLNKLYLGEGQQLDVFQSWLDEMNSLTSESLVNYTLLLTIYFLQIVHTYQGCTLL